MKLLRALKNILRIRSGKSDLARWGDSANLNPGWEERSHVLVKWIRPGDRVIDFGAGSMALKSLLPEGCAYTATDIVSRAEGMLAVDLNQLPLPPLGTHDIAVFSGVLEYLHDVPAVLAAVKPLITRMAVSYSVLENVPQLVRRRANGFANDYTESQFREILDQAGFELLERGAWREQILFHCRVR
jgi:Methyltransferase domain